MMTQGTAATALLFSLFVATSLPVFAQDADLAAAIDLLAEVPEQDLSALEQRIRRLRTDSGSPARNALLDRGQALVREGRLTEGVAVLSALIDHAPDFSEGYYERAGALVEQERYGMALADLAETLAREPRHFDAITLLAVVQLHLETPLAARDTIRALKAVHPRHEAIAEIEAEITRRTGARGI